MLCGSDSSLAGHHFIVNAARSLAQRYNPLNGIALCYGCHIHKVHREASLARCVELADAAIRAGNLTAQECADIRLSKSDSSEIKREHLNATLDSLKRQLEILRYKKLGQVWPQIAPHIPMDMYTEPPQTEK